MDTLLDRATATRVIDLKRHIHALDAAGGEAEALGRIESLQRLLADRLFRADALAERIAELEAERDSLIREVHGIQRGIEAQLIDALAELRKRHPEFWSPFPVFAFRLWAVGRDGLHGFRHRWERPELVARCDGNDVEPGIPHSNGSCSAPGCGVYGTKDLPALLDTHVRGNMGLGFAAALVALSGKVVEHEHGYRAERARVVALAITDMDRLLATSDQTVIARAFHAPQSTLADLGTRTGRDVDVLAEMIRYLGTRAEEVSTWT